MFESMLYCISVICLLASFLLWKKTENKQNIIMWIFISLMILFCFNLLSAYVASLINIKCTLFYFIVMNFIFTIILMLWIIHVKAIQKYYLKKIDIMIIFVLLILTIILGYVHFGSNLDIVYETCDPGTHFWTSMEFFRSSELLNKFTATADFAKRVFGSYVNMGILFKVAYPVTGYIDLYKVYILYDLFMFFVSSVMIYYTINLYMKKNNFIIPLIVSIICILGYPLSNLLFGFFYLGHTLILLACMIVIIKLLEKEKLNRKWAISFLSIMNISIGCTYYFFSPFITLALAAYFIYENKKLLSKKTIIDLSLTCLLPFVICLSFFVIPYIGYGNYTIFHQLQIDGYFYNSGLSNFLIFLPIIGYYLYVSIRNKKYTFEFFISLFLILIIGIFLILVACNISLPYYLSKFSYPLWYMCFMMTVILFSEFISNKMIVIIYSLVFIFLIFNSVFGIEKFFVNKNTDLWNMKDTLNIMDIYDFNRDKLFKGNIAFNNSEIKILKNLYDMGATNVVNNFLPAFSHQRLWLNGWFLTKKTGYDENSIYTSVINDVFYEPYKLKSYEPSEELKDYHYFVIFYREVSEDRYDNYSPVIPFEVQNRWDEKFKNYKIILDKDKYYKIPFTTCKNCKYYEFDDGMIIVR